MRRSGNFTLVPWREDFLEALLSLALEASEGDVGKASFLFPNNRPEKYFSRLLRNDSRIRRPLVMPRMLTISAVFSRLRMRIHERPAWNAGLLDRIGLLLACAREESLKPDLASTRAVLDDAGLFFPWGMKLASLYEECFSQNCKPENFQHAEDVASPFAAALLSRLGNIFARYVEGLQSREWTTPGLDAALVADHLREYGELPLGGIFSNFPDHPLFISGFHALTGSEKVLFHHLWKLGARVVIHADPALAGISPPFPSDGKGGHWSCRVFADWARQWGAELDLCERPGTSKKTPPGTIRYYQGFDLHSQLSVLERTLASDGQTAPGQSGPGTGRPDGESGGSEAKGADIPGLDKEGMEVLADAEADTVVVLPDSGLLMPVLHHLPRTDINISMGYPLSRSPLFRLLDTIARLQEGRREQGYYWRDLVDLIRHPYIKMLRPEAAFPEKSEADGSGSADNRPGGSGSGGSGPVSVSDQAKMPLRRELHRLEQALREFGRRYLEPLPLLEQNLLMLQPGEMPSREVLGLLQKVFDVCLAGFETAATPGELARALQDLCSLLLGSGSHLWDRFLIDAECLFRIMQSLIPELGGSALADERFPVKTLFGMLRRLVQAERVPFEASPLVGLQVMGLLETRLLSFRRVIILEAGEDRLPGSPPGDPLLPEALRASLGLPPLESREQVVAYHFFRLLAGARETLILWQEGADAPGIQEQKKKKSRFVEELLWQEEKKLGRLLASKGADGPLSVLATSLSSLHRQHQGVLADEPVQTSMAELLRAPVSASLLDAYLRCPLQFYFRHLARLAPADDINEGDDPLAVGNLFHQTLQEGYAPHLGKSLPGGDELAEFLGAELEEGVFASPEFRRLVASLPADSAAMLACAAKKRLDDYLRRQPPSTILALEKSVSVPFACNGLELSLTGKADRIDKRFVVDEEGNQVGGFIVLDYKTGRLPAMDRTIWQDEPFWDKVAEWKPAPMATAPTLADPLLDELAGRMQSVQLAFYLLLLSRDQASLEMRGLPAHDAAWVELSRQGEEFFVFPKNFSVRDRVQAVEKHSQLLVNFLLRHMLESPGLAPRKGAHCLWCSSAKLCIRTAAR